MSRSTRRDFLRRLAIGGLGAEATETGWGSSKKLVVVFLRGGADTLNMIVPWGDDEYYRARPTLSIAPPSSKSGPDKKGIKLDDMFAMHPRMKPLYPLFADGELLVVQGVGSDNPTGSHFEAQDQMEHGEAYGKKLNGGWLGRYLRLCGERSRVPASPLSAVAIGKTIPEALRGAPAASALSSIAEVKLDLPEKSASTKAVASALGALYARENGLLGDAGRQTLGLIERIEKISRASYHPSSSAPYPDSELGAGLREVARLLAADVGLSVACIDHGGWDTHFFQGNHEGLMASNIADLSDSLAAFYRDIKPLRDQVTVLVMTEFGRRTYENSSMGTDHGRGFAAIVFGGGIGGGRILGRWPGLSEKKSDFDILTVSGLEIVHDYRSVLAELLSGVSSGGRSENAEIFEIFPGLKPEKLGLFA